MNRFSYYITTHFIPSNKDYHSYCNPHSVYQTYPNLLRATIETIKTVNDLMYNTNKQRERFHCLMVNKAI